MKSKLIFITIIFLFLVGCKGSLVTNFPTTTVNVQSEPSETSVFLLDRKIIDCTLDVKTPGQAKLVFTMLDVLQIGNKTHEVKWKMSIDIKEGDIFKISK